MIGSGGYGLCNAREIWIALPIGPGIAQTTARNCFVINATELSKEGLFSHSHTRAHDIYDYTQIVVLMKVVRVNQRSVSRISWRQTYCSSASGPINSVEYPEVSLISCQTSPIVVPLLLIGVIAENISIILTWGRVSYNFVILTLISNQFVMWEWLWCRPASPGCRWIWSCGTWGLSAVVWVVRQRWRNSRIGFGQS